ncbi:MAG: protein translocase subunit SecF [Gammaproteobacteria bacterium]|nr:protein translocase subunit SecF [Gammaproteobacteria bacterium]|tara:strand:+ start:242 stop:1141 length:900 start_codon:yes stop_codon:yes gene_type:complete
MFKLIKNNLNLNFLGKRNIAITLSSFLIIISLFSFIFKGLNWGIDFSSGYIVQIQFEQDVKVSEIRDNFIKSGIDDALIQYYGSSNEILVKLKENSNFERNNINEFLNKSLSKDYQFKIMKLEFVGSQIGSELREKGEWAMLVALLSILVYIGFRFEFLFGIGAIFALIHDVIITLGFFSLLQIEFNLSVLSAILAVIGYSLNDTIVVYDRIRENIRTIKSDSYIDILNKSINQTLSRTIITSFTTLFVLFSLLILGGSAVYYFALAMIIGILVGTYSSIYIAGTSLYLLDAKLEDDSN